MVKVRPRWKAVISICSTALPLPLSGRNACLGKLRAEYGLPGLGWLPPCVPPVMVYLITMRPQSGWPGSEAAWRVHSIWPPPGMLPVFSPCAAWLVLHHLHQAVRVEGVAAPRQRHARPPAAAALLAHAARRGGRVAVRRGGVQGHGLRGREPLVAAVLGPLAAGDNVPGRGGRRCCRLLINHSRV